MNFTDSQSQAIEANGNLLVVAGAGTGKTRTLVERCVQRLIESSGPEVPFDQRMTVENLLIVTFTEAAATEVRHRVRSRIEEEVQRSGNPHLRDQLELLETAHISTLHSFCFRLIRQHFYELGLDPGMSVLTKPQADVLKLEVLEHLFQGLYGSEQGEASEARALLLEHFHGRDKRVRDLILELHHYTQTRPDPEGWYEMELRKLSEPEPVLWRDILRKEVSRWMRDWAEFLRTLPPENSNAHACAGILEEHLQGETFRALELIARRDLPECWIKGKKTLHKKQFEDLFEEAEFLNSLVPGEKHDPLGEDWKWFSKPARILLSLAREFELNYRQAKRDRGALDFHDLEQLALQLLWDGNRQEPTELAQQWQQKFRYVFVDEYQDINAAQDKIIFCLSRPEAVGNRFLVGDVKQSIYRFRQADPTIFRKYMDQARAGEWKQFFLSHNFRSEERILRFVNDLFSSIMRENFGGISYDHHAALQFGRELGPTEPSFPEVELHLLCNKSIQDPGEDSSGFPKESETVQETVEELEKAELEALWVGKQLLQFKSRTNIVRDASGAFRETRWSDMVILLRSLKGKVESYAKVFEHLGIPLQLKRTSFYSAIEVLDLLNLLTILDNPLQDIPLLAVLRSPFGGFTASELVNVRLETASRRTPFWLAMQNYANKGKESELRNKCTRLLASINRWRELGKHCSISARLEFILQETLYADWVLTQPRGKQRQANVFQFVDIARQFDHLNGEGLYLFLRHIQQEQEASDDADSAPSEATESVRLMSVHQSKGLEFPIVVVPDLSKRFNFQDLHSGLILDEQYGLCTHIKAETTGALYPSLPYWLAQRREKKEIQAEEMRVLYVALTRAQSKLLLVATARESEILKWQETAKVYHPPSRHQLALANSWLDWMGPALTVRHPEWLRENFLGTDWTSTLVNPASIRKGSTQEKEIHSTVIVADQKQLLLSKFEFKYPHLRAITQQAKSTVTRLRRGQERAEESTLFDFVAGERARGVKADASGTDIGKAYHAVLEHTPFEILSDQEKLKLFIQKLQGLHILSGDQAKSLDVSRITSFWQSDHGIAIKAHGKFIHRELPFTVRFTGADLQQIDGLSEDWKDLAEDEFIIVQGAVDLALIQPEYIWILDFKSDYIAPGKEFEKVEQYRPQLHLYALALEKIYQRPVQRKWLHLLRSGITVELERSLPHLQDQLKRG